MIDPRPLFSGATLTTSFAIGRPLRNASVETAVIPLPRFTYVTWFTFVTLMIVLMFVTLRTLEMFT